MNQIVVNQNKIYNVAENIDPTIPPILAGTAIIDGLSREYLKMTVSASYNEAATDFTDNVQIIIRQYIINETGDETDEYTDIPWDDYNIAGDITDHRNGTVTVTMYKPSVYDVALENLTIILGGAE